MPVLDPLQHGGECGARFGEPSIFMGEASSHEPGCARCAFPANRFVSTRRLAVGSVSRGARPYHRGGRD